MEQISMIFNNLSGTSLGVFVLLILVVLSYLFSQALYLTFRKKIARMIPDIIADELVEFILNTIRLLLPFMIIVMGIPILALPPQILAPFSHLLLIIITILVTYLVIRFVIIGGELLLKRYDVTNANNLKARKVHTQIGIIQKILIFLIIILAVSVILLSFDRVRQIGISILASAGVIGLVVGLAAQKTLSTIIAGVQIAITQPIRLDDVVIVEGEWGRIEEITLTYVVVRIWDLRRLVVPVNYFMEQPFQNWTRTSASILGTVYLYTDYRVPVDELRSELQRILEENPLWDKQVANLQITNLKEHSVEIRALMSAFNSSAAWDLRCQVREQLLKFMQQKYPESIVRIRLDGPTTKQV